MRLCFELTLSSWTFEHLPQWSKWNWGFCDWRIIFHPLFSNAWLSLFYIREKYGLINKERHFLLLIHLCFINQIIKQTILWINIIHTFNLSCSVCFFHTNSNFYGGPSIHHNISYLYSQPFGSAQFTLSFQVNNSYNF